MLKQMTDSQLLVNGTWKKIIK